jgi:hypothetical protein
VNDNYRLIDIIEAANDRQPYCGCGRPTEPVYRDGYVWLECSSLRQTSSGRLARVATAVTSLAHVHERIVDVPTPGESLAPAA